MTGRALITGIAGFAGSHLAEALAARGAVLSGLVEPGTSLRNLEPALERYPGALAAARLPEVDLRDGEAVAAAVRDLRPDAVLHLGAIAFVPYAVAHPEETFAVNAGGTRHLLEAVRRFRPPARVVVVSTGEIYGPGAGGRALDEDHPLDPRTPYAASKAEADRLAAEYAARDGLQVVRVRPFNHTGPRQDPRYVCSDFARQVAEAESGRREPLLRVGNLEVLRDFSDVRDIARGYVQALERGRPGAAYNLCAGRTVRVGEILEALVGMARVPLRAEVDPARWRPAEYAGCAGGGVRAARELGWRPALPLARTLRDLLEFWRAELAAPAAAPSPAGAGGVP